MKGTFGEIQKMMKNILLPTDFSENSKNAIRYALRFFEGETCRFHLLNSQKPTNYLTADVLYSAPGTSVYEGILNDNKKELGKMARFCEGISEKEDFSFVQKIDFDTVVAAVNKVVAENNIDLIVMGTNGATGAAEAIFGSNTIQVIRNVDCPVITVPQGYAYEKIDSVLLSHNRHIEMPHKSLAIISEVVKKNKAVLKILEIEENTAELSPQKSRTTEAFKAMKVEQFYVKNIPAPLAISAFEQLIPVQFHAVVVEPERFINRFIFGSDTAKISYSTTVPLLVLHQ